MRNSGDKEHALIDHVGIKVKDVEQSKAFYEVVLAVGIRTAERLARATTIQRGEL